MSGHELFGAPLPRREDRRLVTGQGRFVEDLTQPGCLSIGIIRSPHAHAKVLDVDMRSARGLRGVEAVLSGKDPPDLWKGSGPPLLPAPLRRDYAHPAIAVTSVRHVGEAVAVVVADDPYR